MRPDRFAPMADDPRGARARQALPLTSSERAERWAATMEGWAGVAGVRHAKPGGENFLTPRGPRTREQREQAESENLALGAAIARGAGTRAVEEEPDEFRTCFERDRDRILHSSAFRRLAGKTQVFVFPDDHQRTRLTHALEVAQVATAVAGAIGLNVALVEAIALGHDCGHGPGGHASEDALDPYLPGGFDHAPWGADVVLAPLNLTAEVKDGIRNHSWSRPPSSTAEGEVVSWADRCAYVAHDLEDAHRAGVVDLAGLPEVVRETVGTKRSGQLRAFVTALVTTTLQTGRVGMDDQTADALAQLRAFNYERIYLRPESVAQGESVVALLRALVEHFAAHPEDCPNGTEAARDSPRSLRAAVEYVGGMTDRFAFRSAVELLGWPEDRLPQGIDVSPLRMR